MQDAVVAIAIAVSAVAVMIAAMVLGSMWSSTCREIFKLLFPGARQEAITADLHECSEKGHRHVVADEVHEIHPAPAHPPQQRTRITLRRVLWGVNSTD